MLLGAQSIGFKECPVIIGTGNIVGIATAIISGGPGAIFWMWIMAIFGMMTNYSENVLGIFYRRKNDKGEWCGHRSDQQ